MTSKAKAKSLAGFLLLLIFFLPGMLRAHEIGEVTIHLTESGFEPAEITIQVGSKVIFENGLPDPMWPAANIHPTHRSYPGSDIELCGTSEQENIFDACGEITHGETYGFVFTQPGHWRYHDHLRPQFSGVVVVLGQSGQAAEPGASQDASTVKLKTWWADLRFGILKFYYKLFPGKLDRKFAGIDMLQTAKEPAALVFWLKLTGPANVMAKLLADSGGGSSIDCHTQAHQIGRLAFDIFGQQVFEQGDSSCHSGFYHGAMETFLAKNGTHDLARDIDALCSLFATRFGEFECLHGVGHGVLAYENYDLPRALEVCGELASAFAVSSCHGGVFMENVVAGQGHGAVPGHQTAWVNDRDPHFPCNAVSQDLAVQQECYKMQTSWMLTMYDYNFAQVAQACLDLAEPLDATCFLSYGRDAAGQSLRDAEKIVSLCGQIPESARQEVYLKQCLDGGVNVIIDFWGDKLTDQASNLCRLLEPSLQAGCFATIAARLPELFVDQDGPQAVCQIFPEEYKSLCQAD